ncbi:hypothetical protein B0I27_101305 [Arcticibacter pallidicorallinus]|uniref:Uncharacterized protein n=1 Tax=Arcticibacter pallidicorallinus TaxID=1259464 RepID=A0A2T0UBM1_9SPHI|nr:hypothetical protein B0I27_101305 [Arcticibacter pallidicorallinus]
MKSGYGASDHLMKMLPELNQHNQPEASYVSRGSWYCTKEIISTNEIVESKLKLNFRKKRKKKLS